MDLKNNLKIFLLVATALQACAPKQPSPPTAQAVQQMVTAVYTSPYKHELVSMPTNRPDLIIWERKYDGIAIRAEAKSVLLEGTRWETRYVPELSEPPAAEGKNRISLEYAAQIVGIADEIKKGVATARYVYEPVFIDKPNKPVVSNALDVDRYIEKYVLAVELTNEANKTTTIVDAYSGNVLSVSSRELRLKHQETIEAMTLNYGEVALSLAVEGFGRRQRYYYQDLARCSQQAVPVTSHQCANGQGVTSTDFMDRSGPPIPFDRVNYNPGPDLEFAEANIRNDLYLGIQASWDYFETQHGRRGLGNIPPSWLVFNSNDVVGWVCGPGACPYASGNFSDASLDPIGGNLKLYITGDNDKDKVFASLPVVGHEWAHGVFFWEAQAHIDPTRFYWGEEGGLMEASSDLFGKLIEAYELKRLGLQSDTTIRTWTMPGADRNMCSPSLDGHSYDEWFEGIDLANTDPHYTSGPVNRAQCLIARGLRAFGTSFDEPGLQSPRVPGSGFNGIGTQALAQLWYRTLSKLGAATRPLSFKKALAAELLAAQELYGANSPQTKAVEDAWAAVNVGAPAERTPPKVILLTPGPLKRGDPIEVSATDSDGVRLVTFSLEHTSPVTVTAPPWKFTPDFSLVEGLQVLHVWAWDNKGNSSTNDFYIYADYLGPVITIFDTTPCGNRPLCPEYRLKKRFWAGATDKAGVGLLELVVDGVVVDSYAGASHVFEYTFPAGGLFKVGVRAHDAFNNVTEKSVVPDVFVDTSPPVIYSGPVVKVSTTQDGIVTWDVCATDSSTHPMGLTLIWVDGTEIFTTHHVYGNDTCVTATEGPIAGGSHSYQLVVRDKWENRTTVSGNFYVTRIPATLTTPTVAVDPVNIGRIVISTKITAEHGTKSIEWFAVPVTASVPPVFINTMPFSSSDNLTLYSQQMFGLVPGVTYRANVLVEANNGVSVQWVSADFTIPTGGPPAPVVYNESEPNNRDELNCSIPPMNVVPSNVAQINGTYNATRSPYNSYQFTDSDIFRIVVPLGKHLRVLSSFKCDNGGVNGISTATVSLWRFDPSNGANCSLGVFEGSFDADGAVDARPVYSQSDGVFLIVVNYPVIEAGQLCSNPAYTLNVSVN